MPIYSFASYQIKTDEEPIEDLFQMKTIASYSQKSDDVMIVSYRFDEAFRMNGHTIVFCEKMTKLL